MKLGVVLPQVPGMRDPAVTRDYAQTVESLGFDHLQTFDHVVGAEPSNRPPGWRTGFTHEMFVHEPLVLFAHLGAVTKTLEFVSEIIILPQRETVLFAKQAASIDYLNGGRLRLGLGIGWNTLEYEALNQNFRNRGRRIEEQIEVMRALWTQEVVDFKGKWHTIDRAGVNPLPVQRPIPLWMGGTAENVLRRTGRMADGWMPMFKPAAESSKAMTAKVLAYVKEAGRDPASFGIEGRMALTDASQDEWGKELADWQALGATHVSVTTGGSPNPRDHMHLLMRFKETAVAAIS